MKLAKKSLIVVSFVIMLLIATTSMAFASGVYGPVNSSPAWANTYFANQWSSTVYWDFTNISNIPNGAQVGNMYVDWTVSQNWGYSGLSLAVFDQSGYGFWEQNGMYTSDFNGELVKQKWSSAFGVTQWDMSGNALSVAPRLAVYWYNV